MAKTEEIKIICAWCKCLLGEKTVPKKDGEPTHGICETCQKKFMEDLKNDHDKTDDRVR